MKTVILTLIFLMSASWQIEISFIKSVEVKGKNFKVDPLGNIYIIKDQTIIKYNENGEKEKEYSSSYLGYISYADVSDPFRILLFYKDFNHVLFLDNYLAEIGSPIKLDDIKMDMAEIACSSAQGGFWVFNSQSKQLVYFDKNLQKQQESVNLNSVIFTDKKPAFLIEKSDYLYMYIPETGIIIFDKYGAYYKTVDLKNTPQFQVLDGKILYYQDHFLFKYDTKFLTTATIELPDSIKNIVQANLLKNTLYIFKENKFSIYRINGIE
ncbi:MAG: hypothetical protein HY958_12545 [Bacteroidia bacterium]|nr:hypothetical protein [Bacteroidia bacterium]